MILTNPYGNIGSTAAALLWSLSLLGALYTVFAALVFRHFFRRPPATQSRSEAVTVFKPLRGSEPCLHANLSTFITQEHDGPIQLLCGADIGDRPVIAAIDTLRQGRPDADISLVLSSARHGANAKVSNLVNMECEAMHPVVVLSDSDIVAAPDYLSRLLDAHDDPDVGAVSALYCGRGDVGIWSELGAAGLSYQFLPGAVFGHVLGLARPCMGSTIVLKRPTLERIGGLVRFADVLADDHAIGEAVRALGLRVAIPPMLVTHASSERSFGELWRHELRWGATVRSVVPAAYAMSFISMPVPLALIGLALSPGLEGAAAVLLAISSRMLLKRIVDRQVGRRTAAAWMLPLRDCLTFVTFVASFFVRSVDWRGERLRMRSDGRISQGTEVNA